MQPRHARAWGSSPARRSAHRNGKAHGKDPVRDCQGPRHPLGAVFWPINREGMQRRLALVRTYIAALMRKGERKPTKARRARRVA